MIYIHGMGHFHPENVIDNKFLEDLDIGTNDQWIMERVGIRARRTVLPLDYIEKTRNSDPRAALEAACYTNARTAQLAAEMAIKNAGISADQIGLVIAGGCSPDVVTPAEACVIASQLGINAKAFDLNSACSSFGSQIYFLSMMRPEALPDFILLVSPENNTRTVNYNDRSTAVLWGDGTSAAVISTRHPSRAKVSFTSMTTFPDGWNKVLIPRLGFFTQEGSTVQTFAIKRTVQCYREIKEKYSTEKRIGKMLFIGHQANARMLESVCKRCEIDSKRHFFNLDEFGNQGAAGAPIVLSQNWTEFKDGDLLALIVVGAGLSWASMVIEFKDSQ